MRVVVDTNVLISAILKDKDPEAVLLYIIESPDTEWIASHFILAEYKEVLRRKKFALPEELLEKWTAMIDLLTTVIDIDLSIDFSRDRKDAKFLECAISGNAQFFITGDSDFIHAQKLMDTTIISVSKFKEKVFDKPE
jgi:putative PIN family toxin of toxin-antitoxin system